MKINKYTNYIKIEGLEEHSQAYDEKSFLLKRLDGSSVLFLLEIVSPFEVKLNLNEEVTDETLIVTININGNTVNQITQKPEEETKPIPKPEENSTELEYHFEKDFIVIENIEDLRTGDIAIGIKKYSLDRYDDFPEETINIDIPIDFYTSKDRKIPFEIERDYIYRIKARFRDNIKTTNYIHESPSCYFSSIYHLKTAINEFDLYINENKLTDFDLKLLIWKYSNIAVSIAGITGDIIYKHKSSLLNEFVEKKVLLDIISQAIKEVNITPDSAKKSLGDISVTLADLSHGAATTETVTTQLIKVHKQLFSEMKELEKNLRNYFSYLQTTKEIDNDLFIGKDINRNNSFNPYLPRRRKYR